MGGFVWTPELAVGFDSMDAQHQALIALMARLHEEAELEIGKAEFLLTLDELGELTTRHFRQEEAVMTEMGFPRFDEHQLSHVMLLERFLDYSDDLRAPAGRFTPAFSEFLARWLTGHIKGPDTQYGVFSGQLLRRGTPAGPAGATR